MPPGRLLSLGPQVIVSGVLLGLPVGHREGIEVDGRRHAVCLKHQGALPIFAAGLPGEAGDAPQVPQVPLELLPVPLRLLQQDKGQEGAPLRLFQGHLVLAQGEIGLEADHLALLPPVDQADLPVQADGEPVQLQPLGAQARPGGQEGPPPALQLGQAADQGLEPEGGQLGQGGLVAEEAAGDGPLPIGDGEGTVGRIRLPLGGGQGRPDGRQIFPVTEDVGDGAALVRLPLVQPLLEPPVALGVDPVELHLLQVPALQNLPAEGGELIVPGLQLQPPVHRRQGLLLFSEVAEQLGVLEVAPHVARVQLHALSGVDQGLLQPGAVGQGAGVPVVPDAAPGCLRRLFRIGHPVRRPVVVLVLVHIVAGVGVPQGHLQVGPGLGRGEAALPDPGPDGLLQVGQHFIEVAGRSLAHPLQLLHVLRGQHDPLPALYGDPAAAVVNEKADFLLRVVLRAVPRVELQGFLEIAQGLLLLVQVVEGVAHAEVPVVVLPQGRPVGLHQPDGPPEQRPALRRAGVPLVVAGPGQLHVLLRGALPLRDGLQGVDDLLILVVLMPDPALLQQLHRGVLLESSLFSIRTPGTVPPPGAPYHLQYNTAPRP